MLRRHLICAALGVLLGLWVSCWVELPPLSAQTPPVAAPAPLPALFERGRTYLFAVDCWPTWATQVAAQSFQAQSLNPCFAELGTVTVVRPDGWVEIESPDESSRRWWINTARVYAVQAQPVKEQAVR